MADLERTDDSSATRDYFANAALAARQWAEMSEAGIRGEEELNRLRTTNIFKLGAIRREQERKILEEAIAAEKRRINERLAETTKALEAEEQKEIAKAIAIAAARDKASGGSGKVSKADKDLITKRVQEEFKIRKKHLEEQFKWEAKNKEAQLKQEAEQKKKTAKKESEKWQSEQANDIFGKGRNGAERWGALKNIFTGGVKRSDGSVTPNKLAGVFGGLNALANALGDYAKQFETTMDEIAGKQGAIDTRLQGSKNKKFMGSYWTKMTQDITGFAGVSPLIKQETVSARVEQMVGKGIAFNVEQRATLDVLKDKIATTFDAANGTLLRLVRIQQQDTTAGRLGMESALTAFLNNMYETTEYMEGLAKTVKTSLEEAMSLMTGENALSFEYQIQKWLGSLSSVGMSDGAVSSLANVLGQVAAGKIEGITGGGQGNLVIMAANRAGVNISDILSNGLDQNTTNTLMNSMVDYLAKIYNDTGNSKVIQQQIASVYGLSASDLKAAVNLSSQRQAVANDGLDYDGAMARLRDMAGSMWQRTSAGEMLSNAWKNFQYSLAAGTAANPAAYAMFKIGGLLENVAGDALNFSLPLAYGTGSTMVFDIPNLLRAGGMATGIIGGISSMLGGGAGGMTGNSILRGIGLKDNGIATVTRGNGAGLSTAGGVTVSESGSMVGNSSSDDVMSKTMTDKTDETKNDTATAVDESDETKLSDVDAHIVTIIDILRNIADGNSILKVNIDGEVKVAQGSGL